jgi:uncharacterized protein YxjI
MPSYTVQRRLVSIGRDYVVRNESEEVVFKVDGKVRFARTFTIKDGAGNRLLNVREKLLCLDPTFILKREGDTVATLRRKSPSDQYPLKFEVEMGGAVVLKAQGSLIGDDRINFSRDGSRIGSVSRQQYTVVHEIFHVSAASSQDQALMLALVMSVLEIVPFRGGRSD